MAIFIISYPVSIRDSHISPRLSYQPEGRVLIRESRADMGVEEICHIILIYLSYIFPTNAFDKYKLCILKTLAI